MARTGATPKAFFAQVGTLYAAGVPIISGTDAGIHPAKPHGVLPFAVAELVSCGIPAGPALGAATALASDTCGLSGVTGRLRGLRADLLVVDGDLAEDVLALSRPRLVVRPWRAAAPTTMSQPDSTAAMSEAHAASAWMTSRPGSGDSRRSRRRDSATASGALSTTSTRAPRQRCINSALTGSTGSGPPAQEADVRVGGHIDPRTGQRVQFQNGVRWIVRLTGRPARIALCTNSYSRSPITK